MANLPGGEHIGFNNSVFLSERDSADRNFALAYFMKVRYAITKRLKQAYNVASHLNYIL